MLKVIFTLDYEIHGNGDGSPLALMVEPTRRMLDLLESYGAKLTIMADVAEIVKFKEYKEGSGADRCHYDEIASQLCDAVRRGHDVQLHLHPSYFNAEYRDGRWLQDWSEYNCAGLPFDRMDAMVRRGKQYLEDLLKPVAPHYRCIAFRSANWAMSPSPNVVRALVNNGLTIDSSVFKYGHRSGIVRFDYSDAWSELVPWPADADDVCRRDSTSRLVEVPIYSERRCIAAFLSANRLYRSYLTWKHRTRGLPGEVDAPEGTARPATHRAITRLAALWRLHAWKADFNQCTGRQLVQALQRADAKYGSRESELPFVLIGHSKLFTRHNERSLRPFLAFVAAYRERFGFARFGDVSSVLQPAPVSPRPRRTSHAAPGDITSNLR